MNKKVLAILLILSIIWIGGCSSITKNQQYLTKNVYLVNAEGTYTKAQIVIPKNYKEDKLPLVTLGHGFRGTMDSAGGEALALALAKADIATIRMDYSHYINKDMAKQTNQYTPDSMIKDQRLCIDYMVSKYNVDPDRIGLYGRSLGGRVAMTMANENVGGLDYKALALVAPAGNKYAFQYYIGGEEVWKKKKATAMSSGSVVHQNVVLTQKFFQNIEEYNPCDTANKFDNPVLVIYNLQDYVVLPKTSIECADAYEHSERIQVNSVGGHGYEMSRKHSKLKDQLITSITDFFKMNL